MMKFIIVYCGHFHRSIPHKISFFFLLRRASVVQSARHYLLLVVIVVVIVDEKYFENVVKRQCAELIIGLSVL